jgi:hypothetical protein
MACPDAGTSDTRSGVSIAPTSSASSVATLSYPRRCASPQSPLYKLRPSDLNCVRNEGLLRERRDAVGVANMNEMENATAGWHPDPVEVGQLRWWNGNEWTAYVDKSRQAIPQDKSVGVAFVLTFCFGPLGLFYVSTPIALVALVVSFVVLVLTLGSGLMLTWAAIIMLGCIVASRRHAAYQAWLLRQLAGPGEPSPAARSWWRTPVRLPQRWPTTVADPYVASGEGPSAAEVNGPPGWRPDPTGRFEVRWWNGKVWTIQVMNGGYRVTDPFGAT